MNPEPCPQCRKPCLLPTGAYWACNACRLAITTQALTRERGGPMRKRPPASGRSLVLTDPAMTKRASECDLVQSA